MAKDTNVGVGYLPGNDPDAMEANRRYQEALNKLTQSLDARKNRLFDPVLLAAAEGFLGPTSTGSFGEALGRVAGKVGAAETARAKEEQELAAQQLAVAGQGLELERLKGRDRAIGRYLGEPEPPRGGLSTSTAPTTALSTGRPAQPTGGGLPGAPAASGEPSAAPAGGGLPSRAASQMSGATPKGFEGVEGVQVMPGNPDMMTGRQYIEMSRYDKNKSLPDLIKEANELDRKRFETKEGGIVDLTTGVFYQFPKGERVERQIPGYPGTFKMSPKDSALLDLYQSTNDPKYHEIVRRLQNAPPRPGEVGPDGKPTKAGQQPVLQSEEDIKAQEARRGILEKSETEQEASRRKSIVEGGDMARDTLSTANMFRQFSDDPKAKDMFGILQNNKVSSGIAKLVETGIGVPGYTVGIPEVQNVLRNAGLKDADIAKFQVAAMLMTQMQLKMSQYAKGSISNYEQGLFQRSGINAEDTPQSIRMKADMLTLRAQLDRRIARKYDEMKKAAKGDLNVNEFKNSDWYQNEVEQYDKRLLEITSGNKRLPGAPQPAPRSKGRDLSKAGAAVENLE